MGENILTQKIYSKDKNTGVETQVYPETNTASVVDFDAALAAKGFITSAATDTKINAAIGSISIGSESIATLNNFDFNGGVDALNAGTYIVTNATNTPFIGDANGTLKVVETTSNTKIQTWNGKKYTAYREVGTFNPLVAKIDALTVNGVKVNTTLSSSYDANNVKFTEEQFDTYNPNSKKILWLKPGGTYELSGALINCQIRIGYEGAWLKKGAFNASQYDTWASTNGESVTTIVLNNFYLYDDSHLEYDLGDDDSPESAIEPFQALIMSDVCGKIYPGKVVIKLKDNTKNYIYRLNDGTMETYNNKWGVIYTDGDCDIIGNGSLGIDDGGSNDHLLGGHAIKAKGKLTIGYSDTDSTHTYTPHIKARVYHDIIHGNESVSVYGGYIQAVYCNDVFGTDVSRGDSNIGYIRIYNGVFDIRECFGTFLQCDDGIVYPNVKISFNTIGEGLWLQADSGWYKDTSLKGETAGFGIVNEAGHRFDYYAFEDKPDAVLFTDYVTGHDTRVASEADPQVTVLATTRITYNGEAVDQALKGEKCIENKLMGGIRVYDGVTVTHDQTYSYSESNRNTTFATVGGLTLSGTAPTAPHAQFAYVATTVAPGSGEKTLVEANEIGECLVANANFDSIDFTYPTEVTGGIWNIGITEQGLSSYKNEVDYLLTMIKGMIVPPKELSITSVVTADYDYATKSYTVENVANTRTDKIINDTGAEIKKDKPVAAAGAQVTKGKIKIDGCYYTTKTGLIPTFHIAVGESIRISAKASPEDTTNATLKWSVVGTSEETVIGRIKADDTNVTYCDVRGLQPGSEDIVVSTKALDKDGYKLSILIHIVVDEPQVQGE